MTVAPYIASGVTPDKRVRAESFHPLIVAGEDDILESYKAPTTFSPDNSYACQEVKYKYKFCCTNIVYLKGVAVALFLGYFGV